MDHNQHIPAIAAGVQSRVPEGDIRAANRDDSIFMAVKLQIIPQINDSSS